MTAHHPLLFLAAALAASACVHGQNTPAKHRALGTESWSWRMSATEGKWTKDAPDGRTARKAETDEAPAADAQSEPEAEMTLEPDPVAPASRPKAVARAKGRVGPRPSNSDEEFIDKIIDDNADADDGEITMAAMEMPKAKASKAKKKAAAPVVAISADDDFGAEPEKLTPKKTKKLTRAEKRKARLLAKAEKKKAREIAAREARLRGKRALIDDEERERVSTARKAKRNKKKGQFFKNGEGFIDEDEGKDQEDDDEAVASSDEDEGDDEADDQDEDAEPRQKKKSKAMASKSSKAPVKTAAKGKLKKEKTDWRGQAIDDEDPLKGKKK